MILDMCCIIYTECDFSNDLYFVYAIFLLTIAVGNVCHIDSMLYMFVDDLSIFKMSGAIFSWQETMSHRSFSMTLLEFICQETKTLCSLLPM